MKHVDKKLSDDFTKFLNQKLFYKDGKPLKQTQNKLKFFNECTAAMEEFVNTYLSTDLSLDKQSEPTSSPIVTRDNKSRSADILSIKVKNPIDAGKGATVMTAVESMKADNEKYSGVKNEQ